MTPAGLVIGAACLVLFVVVPIAAAAILMGDGPRWATRAYRAVTRGLRVWACRGRGPSQAHPAARAVERCPCGTCTAELSPVDFARFERAVRPEADPPQTT